MTSGVQIFYPHNPSGFLPFVDNCTEDKTQSVCQSFPRCKGKVQCISIPSNKHCQYQKIIFLTNLRMRISTHNNIIAGISASQASMTVRNQP